MRLYCNTTSPYARKVLVTLIEKGVADRVDTHLVDPWADGETFHAAVPVGKVPALVADDGLLIAESTTICEYVDALRDEPPLIPAAARWDVLARAALAQGLIDAAFASVIENRRPADKRWADAVARYRRVIARTVEAATVKSGRFDLGDIALACGLAYADFRLPDLPWRAARPDLAAWLDEMSQRPSMIATKPN